jgi:hypothetical protein
LIHLFLWVQDEGPILKYRLIQRSSSNNNLETKVSIMNHCKT